MNTNAPHELNLYMPTTTFVMVRLGRFIASNQETTFSNTYMKQQYVGWRIKMSKFPDYNALALILDDIFHENKQGHSATDVMKAALGDTVLYSWCPDCGGEGTIYTMSTGPDCTEYGRNCERCIEFEGMIIVWPKDSDDA